MNDQLTPKAIVAALDAHIIGQADEGKTNHRWSILMTVVALTGAT